MSILVAVLCAIARLVRPARGSHAARTTPRNAPRVRPYATAPLPAVRPAWSPYAAPLTYTPAAPARDVQPQAAMVRAYYTAHEARERAERTRRGVAVLVDLAGVA
ncbi:hypothetical protein HDA32_000126 [Spinactinospora alkalitolerans]|uniref:Uncharacterized protein n=1 Tax=Spinactinospora alkalitolerans TaxID=687207 RepID=A0A852TLA6_9ACTN|nr:hypothetical protein [Spinactinospora alkalitolerans]NYE45006.1 hypothetical protein [Spinactinospora alkalitolerans]